MCGRYYVNDDTAREIEKLARQAGKKRSRAGDVTPSMRAAVITGKGPELQLEEMRWGFPQHKGGGLLINARAETVLERKMFRESVLHRRCIIPASGFYEWDQDRNRATFTGESGSLLCMAGFYDLFQEQECFVIITAPANRSVSPVHDRMPLILEMGELRDWVYDDRFLKTALTRTPPLLKRYQEYEQQSLFPDAPEL